jgi:3-phosphoshikimate 1-carboxyvinyltransferase
MISVGSTRVISRANHLSGSVVLPGDKSISHRYAMLAAVAEGTSHLHSFAESVDCQSTLDCLGMLGVKIDRQGNQVTVEGAGLNGLRASAVPLDAGNSGSTIRMLAGLLSGQSFRSVIGGDASLSRRPMRRIIEPLTRMGARIQPTEGDLPPLTIEGGKLIPIHYDLPVASAQVKTAVLFAGLYADGVTEVIEPCPTRDHSEIALGQFGAEISRHNRAILVRGRSHLRAQNLTVPGDISSAAFFLVAGLLVPESDVSFENIGLNPTRTSIIDFLKSIGGDISILDCEKRDGELVGRVRVKTSSLEGGEIPVDMIPGLIDELPVLAVVGTQTNHGLVFRGAQELRVKESDRIAAVADNLRRMGAEVEEFPDGLRVPGRQRLAGAEIASYGDHRIAMAFSIAGLVAEGITTIDDGDCVQISFPSFFETIARLTR